MQSDSALFHRLIRKQRGQCQKCIHELYVRKGEDILNGWLDHFKEIAPKKENDKFNSEFLKLTEEEVAIIYIVYILS